MIVLFRLLKMWGESMIFLISRCRQVFNLAKQKPGEVLRELRRVRIQKTK
jgi:predicted transcriptional regulator